MSVVTPGSVAELSEIVLDAGVARRPLAIRGGGTKAGFGRPVQAATTISTAALSGITLYEPAEMVIAARAGTTLSEVEATLAAKGQMLPFEPMDHRALLGATGEPTIGGIVAAHVSGPRRIAVGACRDALIGAKFVNGRGEAITSGGRVMKNVTGYDLLKVQAGAHGTLGILTEVTFKVLPVPAASTTMVFEGLHFAEGRRAMSAALASPFEVSGAAWLPTGEGPSRTCLRLENVPSSLDYRFERLADDLSEFGTPKRLGRSESEALWLAIRDARALTAPADAAVWRVSTAPTKGPDVMSAALASGALGAFADWGGGLLWIAFAATGDAGAASLRAATTAAGGHATLVRAPDAIRSAVPVFEPQADALMALTKGLKQVFDPMGVINPGRMYAGV